MLKHTVLFKLKDNLEETVSKTKDILLSMRGNVPMIKDIEVGIDVLKSARSYDIALSVIVDNLEMLELYQQDTYHVNIVKEHMHAVMSSSVAIDYYID